MSHLIKTTWCAWQEEVIELPFPDNWKLINYHLPLGGALSEEEIRQKIYTGLEDKIICRKLENAKSACILIDDLTRPTCFEFVLKCLVSRLLQGEIDLSRINILISLAGHDKMGDGDLIKKMGVDIVNKVKI